MGSFANLGALAGAAEGWNEGSKRAEDKAQHKYDQEREERLLQLKNDRLVAREDTQRTHEVDQKVLGHTQSMELQTGKDEFSTSERLAGQDFKAEEGRLDRESREGIEDSKQSASKDKARPKWKTGRTQGTETMNPDGTLSTTEGLPFAINPITQITYLQKEGMWIAENSKAPPRPPAQRKAAEKDLYDNPTPRRMEIYEAKYGYLPKESIGAAERYLESNPG